MICFLLCPWELNRHLWRASNYSFSQVYSAPPHINFMFSLLRFPAATTSTLLMLSICPCSLFHGENRHSTFSLLHPPSTHNCALNSAFFPVTMDKLSALPSNPLHHELDPISVAYPRTLFQKFSSLMLTFFPLYWIIPISI